MNTPRSALEPVEVMTRFSVLVSVQPVAPETAAPGWHWREVVAGDAMHAFTAVELELERELDGERFRARVIAVVSPWGESVRPSWNTLREAAPKDPRGPNVTLTTSATFRVAGTGANPWGKATF